MDDDPGARVDTATWAARLADLAASAEALSEDIALLAEQGRAPNEALVASGRRVAHVAQSVHVAASSASIFRAAPPWEAVLPHTELLHQTAEAMRTRVAALTVQGVAPDEADAVAAAAIAVQAHTLRLMVARRTIE